MCDRSIENSTNSLTLRESSASALLEYSWSFEWGSCTYSREREYPRIFLKIRPSPDGGPAEACDVESCQVNALQSGSLSFPTSSRFWVPFFWSLHHGSFSFVRRGPHSFFLILPSTQTLQFWAYFRSASAQLAASRAAIKTMHKRGNSLRFGESENICFTWKFQQNTHRGHNHDGFHLDRERVTVDVLRCWMTTCQNELQSLLCGIISKMQIFLTAWRA